MGVSNNQFLYNLVSKVENNDTWGLGRRNWAWPASILSENATQGEKVSASCNEIHRLPKDCNDIHEFPVSSDAG